ncbi:MAG: ATP-binding protein [Nonlabens sp.]
MEEIKRIVLIGGPGTGKTSVINQLSASNYHILPEVSREVTLEARKQGIEQLFLTDAHAFSDRLLSGRIDQYNNALSGVNFYDRGIPDVPAYHRFTGDPIPERYFQACIDHKYDTCFFFPIWEEIYEQDNERYEDIATAKKLSDIIKSEYLDLNYNVIDMPLTSVSQRVEFILKNL